MARAARAALADARAMEEQRFRQQMHGGAFYGAGMVGGSATPSMGLSQFRGGACSCGKTCNCSDSESDEDTIQHEGGGIVSSAVAALGRLGNLGKTAAQIAQEAKLAAAASAAAKTAAAQARAAMVGRTGQLAILDAPITTLALRPGASGALAVRPGLGAYDAALDLRGLTGTTTGAKPTATIASRLSKLGVTPARLAAALAAGVGMGGLVAYFESMKSELPGGTYNFPVGPRGPKGPGGPGGPGPGGPPIPPYVTIPNPDDLVPGTPKRVVAAYLRSGNVPSKYLIGSQAAKMAMAKSERAVGGSKKPSARGEKIRAVMKEHGLSLGQASKYIKENGI